MATYMNRLLAQVPPKYNFYPSDVVTHRLRKELPDAAKTSRTSAMVYAANAPINIKNILASPDVWTTVEIRAFQPPSSPLPLLTILLYVLLAFLAVSVLVAVIFTVVSPRFCASKLCVTSSAPASNASKTWRIRARP